MNRGSSSEWTRQGLRSVCQEWQWGHILCSPQGIGAAATHAPSALTDWQVPNERVWIRLMTPSWESLH